MKAESELLGALRSTISATHIYSVRSAARVCGVSARTVYNWHMGIRTKTHGVIFLNFYSPASGSRSYIVGSELIRFLALYYTGDDSGWMDGQVCAKCGSELVKTVRDKLG